MYLLNFSLFDFQKYKIYQVFNEKTLNLEAGDLKDKWRNLNKANDFKNYEQKAQAIIDGLSKQSNMKTKKKDQRIFELFYMVLKKAKEGLG